MSRPTLRQRVRHPVVILLVLGLGQVAIYLTLALQDGYRQRPMTAIGLVLSGFALYVLSVWIAPRTATPIALAIAVLLGLAFRACLFPEPPALSDDYFRYLWDGRVQALGLNPFDRPPADPSLGHLDPELQRRVNHPGVRTIYPPVAQLAFLAVAALSAGWLGLKTIWLLCDLAIAFLLFRLVPAGRRLPAWITYWWSPLVVVEVAWNAHLDLLGVLPLVAAIWIVRSGRRRARDTATGLALAAASLVKYFPALLVPAAARRGRTFRVLVAFLAALILLYLPYLGAGAHLLDGLRTYASVWRFNDGLYALLAGATSPGTAKAIGAIAVLLVVGQSVRNRWPLDRAALWVTGAILLVAPTVHPWYLLWIVPLLALRPNRAWLYLTGSVFLAYYGLATYRAIGVWPEPWPLRLVIYGPFYALLLYDAWRGSWWRSAWEIVTTGAIRSARKALPPSWPPPP